MDCLKDLVGIRELCTDSNLTPLFWLDDAQGIDRIALAELARPSSVSGLAFGEKIIDTSARMLATDIETLVPTGYTIKTSLNSFCNNCTYTGITSVQPLTGIIIKNVSTSKQAYLSIDSLRVKIASTGTYTIVINDGITARTITNDFTAGVESSFININYKTSQPSVKIYFDEAGVPLYALSCPLTRGCGCSTKAGQSRDIEVKGLLGDTEFTTQYGFIPCASIVCSLDNIMCTIVNYQPKLFALALFYRSASMYFSEFAVTERNNRNASFDEDQKTGLADWYMQLYWERLRGSDNVRGIANNMAAALESLHDRCVECRRVTTAWATG